MARRTPLLDGGQNVLERVAKGEQEFRSDDRPNALAPNVHPNDRDAGGGVTGEPRTPSLADCAFVPKIEPTRSTAQDDSCNTEAAYKCLQWITQLGAMPGLQPIDLIQRRTIGGGGGSGVVVEYILNGGQIALITALGVEVVNQPSFAGYTQIVRAPNAGWLRNVTWGRNGLTDVPLGGITPDTWLDLRACPLVINRAGKVQIVIRNDTVPATDFIARLHGCVFSTR